MKCHWAVAMVLGSVVPLSAQEPKLPVQFQLCFEEPIPGWKPVGCEVIDCCPGCPGLPELVFEFKGDPADRLTIDLAGTALLKTSGNARVVGRQLVVTPGTSTVTGFGRGGLDAAFGDAHFSGRALSGTLEYRQGGKAAGRSTLAYNFEKCPRPPRIPGDTRPHPIPAPPTTFGCPTACGSFIPFMTDHDVPANMGISLGAYRQVSGFNYLNIFVQFSQPTANEPPVDLGIIYAFDAAGRMGSRRYVNLESNVTSPQSTSFISVSGANAWHGTQWGISSYTARVPVMGPFVQVFVYNTGPDARKVSVWGYASR